MKDILPFLGLNLLFLEGELGITLSLGYLLALTVGDSTPLVFCENVTAWPAPSLAGNGRFLATC